MWEPLPSASASPKASVPSILTRSSPLRVEEDNGVGWISIPLGHRRNTTAKETKARSRETPICPLSSYWWVPVRVWEPSWEALVSAGHKGGCALQVKSQQLPNRPAAGVRAAISEKQYYIGTDAKATDSYSETGPLILSNSTRYALGKPPGNAFAQTPDRLIGDFPFCGEGAVLSWCLSEYVCGW